MEFGFKFLLLVASCCATGALAFSLCFNMIEAWRAPYAWRASGTVVEVRPPEADDARRKPSSGPGIVVEYKDAEGRTQRQTFSSYNSAGRTGFADKKVGEAVGFDLTLPSRVPGARKDFRWRDVAVIHLVLGGTLAAIGLLLKFL
jgi:hypothetical protein